MRKIIGGLLAVIGLFWGVLGILIILIRLGNWKKFLYTYSDWDIILIMVLLFIVVGAVVCIIGIHLLNGKKEPSSQTRIYYSSFKLKIAKFVESLFFSLVVFLIVSYYLLPNEWIEDVRYLSIMMMTSSLIALFWAFYWCNISIEINLDGISFSRRKREYAYYPLDMPFYSSVTKVQWNAISIGANREFHLSTEGNNYKRIPCWCVTGRDFSKLADDIDKLRRGGLSEQLESFYLPRSSLLTKKRRRMIATVTSVLTLGGAMTVLLFFDYWEFTNDYAASILIAMVISGSSLLAGIQLGIYLKLARSMPKRIVLTDFGIRVDEQTFPKNKLKRVTIAPSSNDGRGMLYYRFMLGTEIEYREYQLGYTLDSLEDQVYGYGKLLMAIRDWCKEKNIYFEEKL